MKKKFSTFVFCILFTSLYAQEIGLKIGDYAPELSFKNPDGEVLNLSELKGKLVLVDDPLLLSDSKSNPRFRVQGNEFTKSDILMNTFCIITFFIKLNYIKEHSEKF